MLYVFIIGIPVFKEEIIFMQYLLLLSSYIVFVYNIFSLENIIYMYKKLFLQYLISVKC